MSELVLAFDVEYSGIETIAIGASIMDSEFKELDNFFEGIYIKTETEFSERCWKQFW